MDEGHSDKPMKDKDGKQIFSQGGYSSHSRVHERFVFPIPENIPSDSEDCDLLARSTTCTREGSIGREAGAHHWASFVGCKKAVEKVKTNDVRYRVTLTGFHMAFGTKA